MRVLPSSSREWLSLFLFPFKAFTVLAVIMVFIWGAARPAQARGQSISEVGEVVSLGYLLSGLVLMVGGLIQVAVGPRTSALTTFLFGAAAFIILVLLAPMFVVA